MTKEVLQERINGINWWHTMDLPYDEGGFIRTPGRVGLDHCAPEVLTERFGIPEDLTGKTVLDIGGWDGLMSFEAEKRGASSVLLVDCYQGDGENPNGFALAKKALNSNVGHCQLSIGDFVAQAPPAHDVVFYFGVLYHVENPIQELRYVSELTKEYALIETEFSNIPGQLVELKFGHVGDPTNMFYPTLEALEAMLKYVGFSRMEIICNLGNIRVTVKAIK